jgi:hypothetical protein
MDRGIEHQENRGKLALGVVILHAPSNRRQDTAPLIPRVNDALRTITPGEIVHVGGER